MALCRRIFLSLVLVVLMTVSASASPLVLFDEGHGQMFSRERAGELDLSRLSALFEEAGARVVTGRIALIDPLLQKVDALVISGPFASYSQSEIEVIHRFLNRGGRLAVMLHIGPPAARLLNSLGMAVSNGVVREREGVLAENPLDFVVPRLTPHPLTEGLADFSIYGSWALLSERPEVTTLATTSDGAWVDLDRNKAFSSADPEGSFGLVLASEPGAGRVVAFADDAIFQNRFLTGSNEALARNLVRWLVD